VFLPDRWLRARSGVLDRMRPAACALLLLAAVAPASGLYFYLKEGESRCFLEELPPDTAVVGKYSNPDFVAWGSPGFTGSVSRLKNATVADGSSQTAALCRKKLSVELELDKQLCRW
jgi:hypothetical protein